MSPVNCNNPLG